MLEIVSPLDLSEEIENLYEAGLPPGEATGWPDIDRFYSVAPGFWTVITGVPADGKSTWMDCLMLNLIARGWKFVVYSPENQPPGLYLALLIEKLLERPFRKGYHDYLRPGDIECAINILEPNLRILRMGTDGIFPHVQTIIDQAEEIIVDWHDCKVGVVIDPWNELDHSPIGGMNETQMINHELMIWRQWVRQSNKVHGFIIAHPQKPSRDRDGEIKRVGLYDINGSAAWNNKADFGIVIRRLQDNRTEVNIEKCRFRHMGQRGTATLRFNPGTGNFYDDLTQERRFGRQGDDSDPFER